MLVTSDERTKWRIVISSRPSLRWIVGHCAGFQGHRALSSTIRLHIAIAFLFQFFNRSIFPPYRFIPIFTFEHSPRFLLSANSNLFWSYYWRYQKAYILLRRNFIAISIVGDALSFCRERTIFILLFPCDPCILCILYSMHLLLFSS